MKEGQEDSQGGGTATKVRNVREMNGPPSGLFRVGGFKRIWVVSDLRILYKEGYSGAGEVTIEDFQNPNEETLTQLSN